jgi:hypothetical protein
MRGVLFVVQPVTANSSYYAISATNGTMFAARTLVNVTGVSISHDFNVSVSDGVTTVLFTVTIVVQNLNVPPYFVPAEVALARVVPENSANNTLISPSLRAYHIENDIVYWLHSSPVDVLSDLPIFQLDRTTAVLRVNNPLSLDFEKITWFRVRWCFFHCGSVTRQL